MTKPTPVEFDHVFNTTDLGNARRLRHRWGENIRYVPERERWITWDGTAWQWDETGQVFRWAVETMEYAGMAEWRLLAKRGDDDTNAGDVTTLQAHAKRSLSETKLRKMVLMAQGAPGMARSLEDLDLNPWLLAASNGTIDLRTGELRESRREDFITKPLDVEYHADAEAPTFHAMLETIQPDADRREFLQRCAGYTATGSIREQVILLPFGDGSNGKSTFVDAVAYVLGPVAKTTPHTTFTGTRSEHPEALARLAGTRMVAVTESGTKTNLREGVVKAVTGGEPVAARYMYGNTFEYVPQFTVWFPVNWLPEVEGSDHGIWRRLVPIPFEVRIGEKDRDRNMAEKLEAEAAGILAWVVRGAVKWYQEGLADQPSAVVKAKHVYRDMMDHVGRFASDVLHRDPHGHVPNTTLYDLARIWFKEEGLKAPSKVELGRKLGQHGYESGKRSGQRSRLGVVVDAAWQTKLREAQYGL